ncbi:RNA polymerase sigma factor [Sphingobacterium suaedae]|uniref:RNA polymerase sigma factor n=1 Tax=Sphingobacterium suaedae TaxID=1686402 RepID=A0ABW5KE36_9SPHI
MMRTPKFFKKETEQQVIRRFIEGDERAFARVFRQYWKTVYALCFRYTECHSDAEDISQEVFKTLWEKREGLDIHTHFENYLVRATKNRMLNYFRGQQSRQQHEEAVAQQTELAQPLLNTDFLLRAEEQHGYLMARLPEKCREVYRLKYEEALTNQAVADRMGISIKTVEYHLQQAKKALRTGLLQHIEFL